MRRRWWKIHRWIENHTGFVWGVNRLSVRATREGGYPMRKTWLAINPPVEGYAGSIHVRSRVFYFIYDEKFRGAA